MYIFLNMLNLVTYWRSQIKSGRFILCVHVGSLIDPFLVAATSPTPHTSMKNEGSRIKPAISKTKTQRKPSSMKEWALF